MSLDPARKGALMMTVQRPAIAPMQMHVHPIVLRLSRVNV
jgi:hypothetical protein